MDTNVVPPKDVFSNNLQYFIPLFQRPYVWTEKDQWQYLWEDIASLADAEDRGVPLPRHFLGAIVLQEQSTRASDIRRFLVVDGQQRLTTLLVIFDAVSRSLNSIGENRLSRKLSKLVENDSDYVKHEKDRYKVLPTNSDRKAFEQVMTHGYEAIQQDALGQNRIAQAHNYFFHRSKEWLAENKNSSTHAEALADTLMAHLELVSITLTVDENPQQIFETLNARGNPLTAVDLIKNYVFQNLAGDDRIQEKFYLDYWKIFEEEFWNSEITVGRLRMARSSQFITHWLIATTGREVITTEVFNTFKGFTKTSGKAIEEVVPNLSQLAKSYQVLIEAEKSSATSVDLLPTFLYRTRIINASTVIPLFLWLINPELPAIPSDQMEKAIDSLESWMVRRAILSVTTKNYNRFILDIITKLNSTSRTRVGDAIRDILENETGESTFWPSDEMIREVLFQFPTYKTLGKAQTRMLLEAIEDYKRGYPEKSSSSFHEAPLKRDICSVEHIMPQKWESNWNAPIDDSAYDRNLTVHLLGNLTLVKDKLNSSLSNAKWQGVGGKRQKMEASTSILLTREVVELGKNEWTDEIITDRTRSLIEAVLKIWESPTKHKSELYHRVLPKLQVSPMLDDRPSIYQLLRLGVLKVGQILYAGPARFQDRTCVVTASGYLECYGNTFEFPTGAAKAVNGNQSVNGWTFWRTSNAGKETLSDLWQSYQLRLGK
ncbi:GmrSD restriction endonuclease domain-containing protein [Acidithrix ferrooxidans]|uniref:DUF262 domain-containing protein n=1 Tax=Acidithrix ferrooxidans TaxID=1280514 RepID=A0A0D8HHZ8_9ACTN|nr:DUF262 domain-containing protein [Acidithrix ferrooxidans]KJF17620.1 hypothetical protein AXFE_15200 [Acidithrix ferrooxidans]